jgi:dienelactone hydrolase
MYDGWVYPSATHVFDRVLPITHYQGHKVGFDPVAAPQAEQNTQRFLKQHLN